MLTSWKTSQGPQKSMITAPSERRKATGMLPWAGGVSGFGLGDDCFPSAPVGPSAGPALAKTLRAAENGTPASKPNAAAPCNKSLLFMASSSPSFDRALFAGSLQTGRRGHRDEHQGNREISDALGRRRDTREKVCRRGTRGETDADRHQPLPHDAGQDRGATGAERQGSDGQEQDGLPRRESPSNLPQAIDRGGV